MKVLQLCLRLPHPPSDGGTIAMNNISKALLVTGASVKVVAFNTKKHFVEPSSIPEDYRNSFQPEMVYLDASVRLWPAFLNLFSSESYNISRFDVREMHIELEGLLKSNHYDVIQLESLFMAPYVDTIRKHSNARVILRSHNVEFRIWERLATSAGAVKKWYLNLLAEKLKNYECSVINLFDGVIALTQEDHDLFKKIGCTKPILISPISIDTFAYRSAESPSDTTALFHLGSMDWMPNVEAVDWFLDYVFPLIKKGDKAFTLYLAGKGMAEKYFSLKEQSLFVNGKVEDAKGFMADKQIMIVPLLSGGGMRVKIIEGMAMGKTIISTSIGAEGIRYTHNQNIIIADTPNDFSEAILRCISDPDFCINLGRNAAELAASTYDNRVTGAEIIRFYESLETKVTSKLTEV